MTWPSTWGGRRGASEASPSLLDKGVNPKTVADRGGWKDPRHVFQTYAHDVADEDITDVLTGTKLTHDGKKRNAAS